jgi:tRNA dimethylallyltransferase
MNKRKIIFVIGPTSSGKTDIAIDIVKEFGFDFEKREWNAEIVGADSRQIFNDFDLTSGKATHEELNQKTGNPNSPEEKVLITHHLINYIDPGTYFSVFDYQKVALEIIEDIWNRGKVPVVCGGTGQYIDSIYYKEEFSPVGEDKVFRDECDKKSLEELVLELKEKDVEASNRVDLKNKVRVVRALEIINALGYLPERNVEKRFAENHYDIKIVNTTRRFTRDELRARVETRFRRRLSEGMVEEVKNAKTKYNLSSEYLEKLGLEFRYVSQYLDERISYELMVQLLVFETRKYARRQETWFGKYSDWL